MKHGLCLAVVFVFIAAAHASDPLAEFLWKERVLLIATPSIEDARYRQQAAQLAAVMSEIVARNVVLVVATPGDPRRARLPITETDFMVALVGLDGGLKLARREPLTPEALFKEIDSMPMRRSELKSAERAREKGVAGAPMTAIEAKTVFATTSPAPGGGWQVEVHRAGTVATRRWVFDLVARPGPMLTLASDTVLSFLGGDGADLLVLRADGTSDVMALGSALAHDHRPQIVVRAGETISLRLKPGGAGGWALLTATGELEGVTPRAESCNSAPRSHQIPRGSKLSRLRRLPRLRRPSRCPSLSPAPCRHPAPG